MQCFCCCVHCVLIILKVCVPGKRLISDGIWVFFLLLCLHWDINILIVLLLCVLSFKYFYEYVTLCFNYFIIIFILTCSVLLWYVVYLLLRTLCFNYFMLACSVFVVACKVLLVFLVNLLLRTLCFNNIKSMCSRKKSDFWCNLSVFSYFCFCIEI